VFAHVPGQRNVGVFFRPEAEDLDGGKGLAHGPFRRGTVSGNAAVTVSVLRKVFTAGATPKPAMQNPGMWHTRSMRAQYIVEAVYPIGFAMSMGNGFGRRRCGVSGRQAVPDPAAGKTGEDGLLSRAGLDRGRGDAKKGLGALVRIASGFEDFRRDVLFGDRP